VPSRIELENIRRSVAQVGRLSDSLAKIGPLRIGLDGLLSWIPGVGELYSTAAGAFILVQAARARVPIPVILTCAGLMGARTAVSAIPLAGPAAADLFRAHRWSASLVEKAIDRQLDTIPHESPAHDLGPLRA
jgi:hypothetical protein